MTETDRESLERLAATCERRGHVSPPRDPSDYSAFFTCQEVLDMAKCVRTLLARLAEVEEDAEARFREIERLYYAEGKDLSWRAAHMRAIAEGYFTAHAALTEKGTDNGK